ncbi:peptidylprolyl isomerase [Lentibacillus sp. JNUCC-1]|uniref:peptidylprolyl isomerase n=1 Tax=Lentibacillus sp. JNUCC-1 TaxID=2654513 RepID=UPI0012E80C21|nr:peptidylprolyl isomerase [Lentibacillus sp. JNUCC-1]
MVRYQLRICKGILILGALLLLLAACGTSENEEEQQDQGENESTSGEKPTALIEMGNGETIKIELYPDIAPNTVANFVSLAEDGFYDGLIFHRVIPGFMIQGGDPEGNGTGGPGHSIKGEFSSNGFENDLSHERGVLSMARSGDPDSAGSQFFIMTETSTHLDGDYAAFGKVVEGMDTVDQIVSAERDERDKPLEDQRMKKVTINKNGNDIPKPDVK